jgi:TetR/AcrR family transcriptional regulator
MSPNALIARRRRLSREVRESLLLRAALDQFVACGFAASRMEDVAARAGVAKGTPYLYFSSKEGLLRSVIAQFLATQIEAVENLVQRQLWARGAADIIRLDVAAWWSRVIDGPAAAVFKLLVADAPTLPDVAEYCAVEVFGRLERLMATVIQSGVGRDQFLPLDAGKAAGALNLPLIMLCVYRHSMATMNVAGHHIDAQEFIASHIRRIVRDLEDPAQAFINPERCGHSLDVTRSSEFSNGARSRMSAGGGGHPIACLAPNA